MSAKLEKGNRSAMKFIRLHGNAINFITILKKKYIVTGGEDGYIKIFDLQVIFFLLNVEICINFNDY